MTSPESYQPWFSCFATGDPQAQGSSSAYLTNLEAVRRGARPVIVVTSANPKLKAWRKSMAIQFKSAKGICGIREPMDGQLVASYLFIMPRLKSTKDADLHCETGFDLDKMIRAVNDALEEAEIVINDKRVCWIDRNRITGKRRAALHELPGVSVTVRRIEPEELEE